MANKIISYPYFKAGQVLSSSALNEAFEYPIEQIRLTRSMLIGSGVIDGLHYSYSSGRVLTIHAGTALSPDGNFLQIEDDTKYSRGICQDASSSVYKLYEKREADELGLENQCKELPKTLDDYYVVLATDYESDSKLSCSHLSCDTNLVTRSIVARPMLVHKSSEIVKEFQKLEPVKTFARTFRMTGFRNILTQEDLYARFNDVFKKNNESIAAAIQAIADTMDSDAWENIVFTDGTPYSDGAERKNKLLSTKKDILGLAGKNLVASKNDTSYRYHRYLLFQNDMAEAVNEYIGFYNEFIGRYPDLSMFVVQDESIRGVVLGFGTEREAQAIERFCWAYPRAFAEDCAILERLMLRIIHIEDNFIRNDAANSIIPTGALSFSWQSPGMKLGDNAIPSYYDLKNGEVNQYWTAHQLSGISRGIVEPSAPDFAFFGASDILKIDRLISRDSEDAVSQIDDFITRNEIPITVKSIVLRTKDSLSPVSSLKALLSKLFNEYKPNTPASSKIIKYVDCSLQDCIDYIEDVMEGKTPIHIIEVKDDAVSKVMLAGKNRPAAQAEHRRYSQKLLQYLSQNLLLAFEEWLKELKSNKVVEVLDDFSNGKDVQIDTLKKTRSLLSSVRARALRTYSRVSERTEIITIANYISKTVTLMDERIILLSCNRDYVTFKGDCIPGTVLYLVTCEGKVIETLCGPQ